MRPPPRRRAGWLAALLVLSACTVLGSSGATSTVDVPGPSGVTVVVPAAVAAALVQPKSTSPEVEAARAAALQAVVSQAAAQRAYEVQAALAAAAAPAGGAAPGVAAPLTLSANTSAAAAIAKAAADAAAAAAAATAAAAAAVNAARGVPPSAAGWMTDLWAQRPAGAPAPNGSVAQLWEWWERGGRVAPAGAKPAFACLADAFKGAPRDRKVFSQWGEDGILEAIFGCIGEGGRTYVEFGTEDGSECTTRYLRAKGWSGLLMDGRNANPAINLHTEHMRSDNIAVLFRKYSVPHPTIDHVTVDIDLNSFWVLRAVLAAGYRPRSLAVEFNRNFAPDQAYATLDMPAESWAGTCYFSASALAYERLMRAHGYSLVAFDLAGVNLFFVHDAEIGAPPPAAAGHSFAGLSPDPSLPTWQPMHAACQQMVWAHIEAGEGLAGGEFMRHMQPVVLAHSDTPLQRKLHEVHTPGALLLHRHRRHPSPSQRRR